MKTRFFISGSLFAAATMLAAPLASADQNAELDVRQQAVQPAAMDSEQDSQSNEAMLQYWQKRLETYKRMGGPAIRSGLVRRAEREVARYRQAIRVERGEVKEQPATPVAAQASEARAERLRDTMFGAGYRTGLVQRAQADARSKGSHIGVTEDNVVPGKAAPNPGKTAVIQRQKMSGN